MDSGTATRRRRYGAGMTTMKKLANLPVALLLLLGGLAACGGSDDQPDGGGAAKQETTQPEPEATKEPEPKYDGKAYVRKVRKAIEVNYMDGTIESQCDYKDMTWHCFFKNFESPMAGWIKVNLSFPGDYSQFEVDEISEDARSHVFNLAGLEVTDLETVFTYANGVDSGTTYRRDMPLLNRD